MLRLWASLYKNLLLLTRDRAGLLVLFLMPSVLVLVVTLVQNNVLEATGGSGLKVLLADEDRGAIGEAIRDRFARESTFQLIDKRGGAPLSISEVRQEVARGKTPFGILITQGSSDAFSTASKDLASRALSGETSKDTPAAAELEFVYDPTIQQLFRVAVTNAVQLALFDLEAKQKSRDLAGRMNAIIMLRGGAFSPGSGLNQKALQEALATPLLPLASDAAFAGEVPAMPNAVQQNVPAWSLFGMFFIVVPLSGIVIRERQDGTLLRLLTQPGTYGGLLFGKVLAFTAVCMVQFTLMLIVGTTILPWLGTPSLELGGHLGPAYAMAMCAAFAACGYGLLLGTLARTYEQGSMFGSVSVVIAAALGGVMVPVFVMPRFMQTLSQVSPLNWGLNGFYALFVRGGSWAEAAPWMLALLAFALTTSGLAWLLFQTRRQVGK
mgnify:CR=1 FL=1